MNTPALRTAALIDGVTLRRLAVADLAAFQAYRRDPELGRYQGWSPMPDAEAAVFLSEMSRAPIFFPGSWSQLGITEPPDPSLIGDIGLFWPRMLATSR